MGNYKQLDLLDRKRIQEGIEKKASIREIASAIGRSPSTVSREIRQNRTAKAGPQAPAAKCRERSLCAKTNVCGQCRAPGSTCAGCKQADCRTRCEVYAAQAACSKLGRSPWVCNACRHFGRGCARPGRYVYSAAAADSAAKARRSESRIGIDMSPERAAIVLPIVKDALLRGLSPYEISVSYAEEIGVHPSTLYRWIERGYGDTANIMLERKVGFKPRSRAHQRRSTSHSPFRSYEEFCKLDEDARDSRTEIDSVEGLRRDKQAILSVYLRQVHLQLYLLEEEKTCEEVKRLLGGLCKVVPENARKRAFFCCLTDNGAEFEDEGGIAEIIGEEPGETRLYYCDPRQSQQKGSCEKNHTELRQILPKGMFSFDELAPRDLSVIMSHVNSNPRMSLGGLSPIEMFLTAFGEEGQAVLDALGVELVDRDSLMLKPEIINIERKNRGEDPLTRLK